MSDGSGSKPKGKEDFVEIDKELDDIQEDKVHYDSDGAPRARSPGRCPSVSGGSVSSSNSGSKGKRRTWKKPKDKPKRPLSAYNIFFKLQRSRIVEGKPEEYSAEEAIQSIEGILSTSRETRRHRKTHGQISFGDLARKIAEKWKGIGAEQKAVFEHYAELDMRRYRVEVKNWKDKKEAEAQSGADGNTNSMNDSFSSLGSEAEYGLDNLLGSSQHSNSDDAWAPRPNFYDSMNSSFTSVGSELSLEPIPIGDMLRNARPNMHASMPNINTGIPGFVDAATSSQLMGNPLNQGMSHFGQQSLSNMLHFTNQGMQMDNTGPPLVVSNMNPRTPTELDQLRLQNNAQQQQLQRQQQILIRQQQLLQQQLQQTNHMINNPGMGQQQHQGGNNNGHQFDQLGDGSELENYLSNLDLSNM
jgi:hypothetical protein